MKIKNQLFNKGKSYLKSILLFCIAIKVGYFLMLCIPGWIGKDELYKRNARWFESETSMYSASQLLCRNDCGYYKAIAEKGYEPTDFKLWKRWDVEAYQNQARYAFFPMMSVLVGTLSKLTGLTFGAAGSVLMSILSIALFFFFYRFAQDYLRNDSKAFWATLVIIVFPFHFYFSMIYTETIFLLLLLISFWGIRQKKWFLLIPAAVCLVLTRPNGIIMGLPLVLYYFEQHIIKKSFIWKRLWPILALSLIMFLTFGAYCWFLYHKTGDFLAFNTVQELWDKKRTWPWESLYNSGDWRDQWRSHYTVLFMALAIIKAREIPLSFNVLIWLNLLLPLLAFSNQSMPRYISVIFPFFLILGPMLAQSRWRYGILTVLIALHYFTFYYWIVSDPFSY